MFKQVFQVFLLVFVLSGFVLASGTLAPSTAPKGHANSLADITYNHGKSIFKGRNPQYGKISYCLSEGGELKKLKRKTLKPYVGGSVQDLADNLYNCDVPTQKIQTVMNDTDMTALLFYLNRRNKLKMKR